jgi:hypothetical protein
MNAQIRPYRPAGQDSVVELAIRAWAPVFASLERVLGQEMFVRLHGSNWEDFQRKAVRGVLADPAMHVWAAAGGTEVVGFVAAALNSERLLGEIVMLATDPVHQGRAWGGR